MSIVIAKSITEQMERGLFMDSGISVFDHPGAGVTYLNDGRLARVVCMMPNPLAREEILGKIDKSKETILLSGTPQNEFYKTLQSAEPGFKTAYTHNQ